MWSYFQKLILYIAHTSNTHVFYSCIVRPFGRTFAVSHHLSSTVDTCSMTILHISVMYHACSSNFWTLRSLLKMLCILRNISESPLSRLLAAATNFPEFFAKGHIFPAESP
jgi:hypothetical protein